ncbi:protein FAM110A [Denticeps clupeoides]|uniref:Uncharacterized protein n=1 Tax=Denticeps clupeoides TaxID=299321 RepID=A0AAY4ADS0_9TELE|nr:protein FAM110A-like [Denticeps clupeoides]
MKPLTPIGSPSPLRLLNKGPDYLRRQMDGGNRGRSVSAVERLEADKAKYVKSQQVINTKQEPVLAPCATPPPLPRRPLAVPASSTPRPTPRRPQNACTGPAPGPPSRRDENEDDSRKENHRTSAHVEEHNRNNAGRALMAAPKTPVTFPLVAPHSAPVLRRSTGKRMLRPDSLLIYRQKKECKSPAVGGGTGNGGVETRGYSFVRRLFQGSMREKSGGERMVISEERSSSRDGDSRMSWSNDKDTVDGDEGNETRRSSRSERGRSVGSSNGNVSPPERPSRNPTIGRISINAGLRCNNNNNDDPMDPWKPVVQLRKRPGLQRSISDLRLRFSLALSDQERFFDYCGLDLDVVERLGVENFLSGGSSVDALSLVLRSVGGGGSEPSEFSRHSGEGLFQEELAEQPPTGVSIIERNARVIKWLYGCKHAAQEGPKESTV